MKKVYLVQKFEVYKDAFIDKYSNMYLGANNREFENVQLHFDYETYITNIEEAVSKADDINNKEYPVWSERYATIFEYEYNDENNIWELVNIGSKKNEKMVWKSNK